MRASCVFVEIRTSRGVETQTSSVGWVCLRTRTSCLVLKMRKLYSGTGRKRVSCFGASRTRVSRLDAETRGWVTQTRVLEQKRSPRVALEKRECEPRILYLQDRLCLQSFQSIVDESDAFIDVQHSGWVSRVVRNPRQPEIAKFRKESDGGIDLHYCFNTPKRLCVLSHCLGASGAWEKKFLELSLVEFNDEGFHCPPEELNVSLRHCVLISKEWTPQRSRHILFCQKKCEVKLL